MEESDKEAKAFDELTERVCETADKMLELMAKMKVMLAKLVEALSSRKPPGAGNGGQGSWGGHAPLPPTCSPVTLVGLLPEVRDVAPKLLPLAEMVHAVADADGRYPCRLLGPEAIGLDEMMVAPPLKVREVALQTQGSLAGTDARRFCGLPDPLGILCP